METPFWLKVVVILVLLATGIIFCYNAATYNELASNKTDLEITDISAKSARTLMWFNIIFAAILFIMLLWYCWAWWVVDTKYQRKFVEKARNTYAAFNPTFAPVKYVSPVRAPPTRIVAAPMTRMRQIEQEQSGNEMNNYSAPAQVMMGNPFGGAEMENQGL